MPAFADDSGLAVDALDGEPGIHSARWAGPDKDFARAMERVEDTAARARRQARRSSARAHFVSRAVRRLARRPRRGVRGARSTARWSGRRAATKGFGYDPMFLPDGQTRTFGEMPSEEKHGLPPHGHGPVAPRPRLPQARGGVSCQALTRRTAFGVYVHWPFCLSKCPYCDFNSHVRHAAIDEARFAARVRRPRSPRPPRARPAAPCRRIFFGGGTPSLMQPATVGAILDAIAQALDRRARRRGHARSQSDQRRGDALSRLSRGRRQPRLARRAGARRRRAEGARPAAHRAARRSTRSRSRARPSSAIRST